MNGEKIMKEISSKVSTKETKVMNEKKAVEFLKSKGWECLIRRII